MRILVTGSSGLIGHALCEELLRLGHQVDEYDLRPPPRRVQDAPSAPRDIRDRAAIQAAVDRANGVIHLAAISRCAPAEADPALTESINVEGTRAVAGSVAARGSDAWMIFASSREVYGEPNSIPVRERDAVNPKSVYGHSKASAEGVMRAHFGSNQGRALILRLTNVYGSRWDYPDRVVPAFLQAALAGRPLEVRGAEHTLDLLHLSDAVRAIVASAALLRSDSGGSDVINVASGTGVTLRDLASEAISCTRSSSSIHEVDPASWAPSRFVADIHRAREKLGWEPRVPLGAGLNDMARLFTTDTTVG
jgi:nucleoside-diphosphate-sugar epimerase